VTDAVAAATATWRRRHLLDVDVLGLDELNAVVERARELRPIADGREPRPATLRGRQVAILFYEASTRTRVSFELAARSLSADVVNIAVAASSVAKGESLVDTVRTLDALGARALVVRHGRSGAAHLAAAHFPGSVINGGDGWHAHPTQALLDLLTLRDALGDDLRGRRIVILGDVLHSRVARSNIWSLTTSGADVVVCGPPTLLVGFEAWARSLPDARTLTVTSDPSVALRDADAVMALRLQRERQQQGLLPSVDEYVARYGLSEERLRVARADVHVLHPGPMNEGVEISADVAAGPRSLVTRQVANGVAVRMAVLDLLLAPAGGGGSTA
jgi:aspartate carbamoyltransferase catalytic subunit